MSDCLRHQDLKVGVCVQGEVQESWSLFKHHFLRAQDRCIPLRKKSKQGGRRLAWMNKELLVELIWKRKVYRMWKEGSLGRNKRMLSNHAEMQQGRLRPTWN